MDWANVLVVPLAGLAGTFGGYLLKDYLDRRKAAEERSFADKREHYRNLLLCLKSFREGSSDNADLFWFEYSFLWLHAPDPVIRSANALVARMGDGVVAAESLAPFVGDLLLQIRRDLRSRTSLSRTDFKGRLG